MDWMKKGIENVLKTPQYSAKSGVWLKFRSYQKSGGNLPFEVWANKLGFKYTKK